MLAAVSRVSSHVRTSRTPVSSSSTFARSRNSASAVSPGIGPYTARNSSSSRDTSCRRNSSRTADQRTGRRTR